MEKILIAGVILLGGFLYHFTAVNSAYEKGKNEITEQWNQDKQVRQAIVDQKLKEKEQEEQKLKELFASKQVEWEASNAEINARYNDSVIQLERMRNQLKRASANRNGVPLDPGSTCTAHAVRITQIAELLREGTELHVESIRYLEQLGIKVEQLQEIVKAINAAKR